MDKVFRTINILVFIIFLSYIVAGFYLVTVGYVQRENWVEDENHEHQQVSELHCSAPHVVEAAVDMANTLVERDKGLYTMLSRSDTGVKVEFIDPFDVDTVKRDGSLECLGVAHFVNGYYTKFKYRVQKTGGDKFIIKGFFTPSYPVLSDFSY